MSNEFVVCDHSFKPHPPDCHPGRFRDRCRNPRPASPALVEGERQELLGKEGVGAALAGVVAAVDRCGCFNLGEHAHYCHEAMDAAREALAAAPPISLEEQAQPDAQDLTEEEIAKLEALEAAATPGDWRRHDSPANFDGRGLPIWDEDAQSELWDRTGDEFLTQGWHCKRTKENFDFIAAARSALPRLIANEKRRRGIK